MTPERILAALLAGSVVVALSRLAWRHWRTPPELRARPWRIAVLAVLQPVCAALLYLTLHPPATTQRANTLVVATANAPRLAGADVALPEAPPVAGAKRVPDLATALRHRSDVQRLRIVGDGLEARDREAARGLALAFTPPPLRRGIVALEPPLPQAPGGTVRVGGRVAGVSGGSVDLLDPAGARVDRQPLGRSGAFSLTGAARAPGFALFRIVVRDAGGTVEQADVPVVTDDDPAPRVLLLAGAPNAEVKYLRRWATDAGLPAVARITAGGGAVLGDAPVAVDAATLARFDVAIVDERSWAGLGQASRAALTAAVRGGMGLVVRVTGPVPAGTRAQWRALGLAIASGEATAPAPLAGGVPILTRRVLGTSPAAVPAWRDARGAVLTDWRAVGRGRVALWSAVDAFTLVLTGHADRYGRVWSDLLAAVARPRGRLRATVSLLPRAGERVSICAAGAGVRVEAPEGHAAPLADPASGPPSCAAYFPQDAGWRTLTDRDGAQPFYVYPPAAVPAVRAAERAEATTELRRARPSRAARSSAVPGASWPWFLALLATLAGLWWFERARWGRATRPSVA